MKKTLVVVLAAVLGLSACANGGDIAVDSNARIVIAPDASKVTQFAAAELREVLGEVFGSRPTVTNALLSGSVSIVVGDNDWSRKAGVDVKALPRDGFTVKATKSGNGAVVFVTGVDDPEVDAFKRVRVQGVSNLYYERASLFGVYEFLERFAGVRFYFPGELGTVVPHVRSFKVPVGTFSCRPDLTVRKVSYFWDGEPFVKTVSDGADIKTLNCYRQRFQTEEVTCSHGQNGFYIPERFAKTNPEYFQLRKDGTRCLAADSQQGCVYCRQLCQSSPVWDVFHDDIVAYLRGEPASSRKMPHWRLSSRKRGEFAWGHNIQHKGKFVDVMPQDGMKACFCEKCQAAYKAASDPKSPESELVWGRTAELARRLTKEGHDVNLVQMAYGGYQGVPAVDLPTNIWVMLAQRGPWSVFNEKLHAKEVRRLKEWNAKLGHKVWLWNYPGKYACGNSLLPDIPNMTPHAWGEYYKRISPWAIGAYAETNCDRWLYNYLNYYVYGKVSWDVRADVGALIDEHHRLMFGKAAVPMKAFYDALEKKWLEEVAGNTQFTLIGPVTVTPTEHDLWFRIYSPKVLAEYAALFKEAEAAVAPGSIEAKRVAFFREQFLKPLADRAAAYVAKNDPELAKRHNAEHPELNLVKDEGWLNGGRMRDDSVGYSAPHSYRLATTKEKENANLYYTFPGKVPKLKPNTNYRLSYFVKTKDLVSTDRRGGGGAVVSLGTKSAGFHYYPDGRYISGTTDWRYLSFDFRTGDLIDGETRGEKACLTLRIRNSAGTAWFNDVRIEERP